MSSSLGNDKKEFELAIWDGEVDDIDDCESWHIKVEADENVLVKALEYVCRVAESIHAGRIQQFIAKMNFLIEP